jgi:acyl-CoA synthetase (AMP-forming)/AMP-acid ligase II
MVGDADARLLFVDASAAPLLAGVASGSAAPALVALDEGTAGTPFERWLLPEGSTPRPVEIRPAMPFNIIYSSGTTGTPKGIVQPHGMTPTTPIPRRAARSSTGWATSSISRKDHCHEHTSKKAGVRASRPGCGEHPGRS